MPDEPVQHVDFFEAEAFARFAGGRLPTEQEWEKACAWDPVAQRRRRWPWGEAEVSPALANLGGEALRPARVGAYPAGASAYGVEQLVGDVWEWTSSGFEPWPGFTPMVYAQYSAPFFGGDFRVLRGGSWRSAGRRSGRRSATGTCRSGARSSPAAAGLGRRPRRGCLRMCRHLAWVGEPRSLADLVLRPEHGLLRQSYQPRRQSRGLVNADGWGVGFWSPDAPDPAVPVRWRSARPLWG